MPQPIRHAGLSAKLEEIRNEKKQSIRHVALEIGVDYGHVNRVFHGQSLSSRKILIDICRALGCSQQQAIEIFKQTDYRAPTQEELDEHPSLLQTA